MMGVLKDEKLIDEFLERGVAEIFPSKKIFKERLLTGKKLRVYCGFDPSAPSLHIGNAILINKLAQFQKMGHEVIFLIGDFTGMIGDPTDKSAARKKLTREEVIKNSKNYKKLASAYLDFSKNNSAKIRYNSEWNDHLTFKDLIEIASNFTVQNMLQRDMFQKRLVEEKPIYFHEFLYPLAQGYDSLVLDVDVEIGGNDQMFNMLCGRDLVKAVSKKEKFVLTMKLLADEKGKKMGKSEGNVVWLDDTPTDMFGKVMSWPDGVIGVGFELCTNLELDKIKKIYQELKDLSINPRDRKLELAYELTKINHGEKKAKEARDYFEKVISKKELPAEIAEIKVLSDETLVDVLVKNKLATSKADARRKMEQGGIKLDNEVVSDWQLKLNKKFTGKILKAGKREFRRINIV